MPLHFTLYVSIDRFNISSWTFLFRHEKRFGKTSFPGFELQKTLVDLCLLFENLNQASLSLELNYKILCATKGSVCKCRIGPVGLYHTICVNQNMIQMDRRIHYTTLGHLPMQREAFFTILV